ncbi:MAG TPA: HAMP domain-containing sensor histidine kinase [Gemmatimonadales bacterium]|nr:HAMP domain-containing sensor histidine kinase [Gemmatimonadales bacterium]
MRLPLHTRLPRTVSITVLLVLALAFAVVLALQAVGASQHQKAQAERVMRDYTSFAAAQFASRSAGYLWYYAFTPAIKRIDHARGPNGRLPDPARLKLPADTSGDSLSVFLLRRVETAFEFDTATGRFAFGGTALSPAWQKWLADTIAAQMLLPPPSMEEVSAVLGGPPGEHPLVAVFTLPRTSARAQSHILGIVTDVAALRPYFERAFTSRPLLVKALTGGVALDSVGSVVVRDAHGRSIYQSEPQYRSSITRHDTLGSYMAKFQVDVTLRPDIAGKLVIGGLPKSRMPLLVTLLLLTAGLIVIALIQLRRESDLAALRTHFVSGVSHELRTPLAQIRMFAETLVLGRVRSDEERARSLAIIDQEARRLTNLVENLLHFSRAERQSLRVAPVPTLVGPLIRGVLESFAPLAGTRRVHIATSLREGAVALADEGALRQMLLNLLDNAVKYGPEGQVVTVGMDPPSGDRIRIWVQDQGPGIPAAERERIWQQFWRLERDRGSAVAGTGIGLSVVRQLAALHRGRVWVETAPGGGARFVIELPTAPHPVIPASPTSVASTEPTPVQVDT